MKLPFFNMVLTVLQELGTLLMLYSTVLQKIMIVIMVYFLIISLFRKDVRYLKEGEEEKTKAYCALCLASQGYSSGVLEKVSKMREVRVNQKTPLRVLHRRPLATRPRIIHTISATPIDSHYFKVLYTLFCLVALSDWVMVVILMEK